MASPRENTDAGDSDFDMSSSEEEIDSESESFLGFSLVTSLCVCTPLFSSELNLASQKQGVPVSDHGLFCFLGGVVLGPGSDVIDHFWSSADHTCLEINDQNSYHCNFQFIAFQKIYDNSKQWLFKRY